MAVTLSVELTDLEYAALAHIAVDPHDWFQDMVRLRCKNTIAEIADKKIKEMIADPSVSAIPADKNTIFEDMVNSGTIKTAATMLAEENIAGAPPGSAAAELPSTAYDLTPDTPSL